MSNSKSHLVKYSAPTQWDIAPYATIWQIKDPLGDDIRIQMSKDIDNPRWVPLPDILVKAFDRFYTDPYFIDECIKMYESQEKGRCDVEYVEFIKKESSE